MILQQCDICGRIENSWCINKDGKKYRLQFSNNPLKLTLNNYAEKEYHIYLDIGAQKASDTEKIKSIYKTVKNMKALEDLADMSNMQEMISLKMDNPFPSICNDCKKKLIIKILSDDKTEFSSF